MAAREVRSLSHWERVGVRRYGPSIDLYPLTRFAAQIDLSHLGRGSPNSRRPIGSVARNPALIA
jgi:hypothetical protein